MRTEAALSEFKSAIMGFADAANADSVALMAALRDLRADTQAGGELQPTKAEIDAWSARALTLLNQLDRLLILVGVFQSELTVERDRLAAHLGAKRVN